MVLDQTCGVLSDSFDMGKCRIHALFILPLRVIEPGKYPAENVINLKGDPVVAQCLRQVWVEHERPHVSYRLDHAVEGMEECSSPW